jgi:hypothetical protein
MSEQIIAFGATVERSTDGATWIAIPECKGVAVPEIEQEYLDATSLDSPNGFREYVKGLKDAGTISLPVGYTAAGYAQQIADRDADDPIYYKITLRKQPSQNTTGDIFEFQAFPNPKVMNSSVDGLVEMTVDLRITGDVDWTQGS